MRIGKLRHLATIFKLEKTKDELGGKKEEWVEFARAWVEIQYITGNEKYIAHEKYSEATHKIFMRYIANLKPDMRIEVKSKTYEIVAVQDSNLRGITHILIVKEVINA